MKAFHEVRNYRSDFMVWQCAYTNISFLAHWHQEIELVYLRSGSARFCINEHNFTARAGRSGPHRYRRHPLQRFLGDEK